MRFRKVKIVRGREVVEYDQNLVDWKKHVIRVPWDQEFNWREHNRRMKTLKKPGKKLKLENTSWFVIDVESGEKITRCDSIEQAKKFCIKNCFDFGMY
jgi:hypothetical protein